MNVALMVITDGRWDYLEQTLNSAEKMLKCDWQQLLLVDDSGETHCPTVRGFDLAKHPERRGLAGAIQSGWDNLADGIDYVFHLEDDFTFPDPVDVVDMVSIMETEPDIAQVALLRQPWSSDEQAAGSVYATHPGRFTQRPDYVEQTALFTFNPCLYPTWVTEIGAGLEQDITDRLDGYRFAYLGNMDDPPRCIHIGARRSAGYRW